MKLFSLLDVENELYAILDQDHNVIKSDLMTWGRFVGENRNKIVQQDRIKDVLVSTVFLGLNHNWNPYGPPLWFETMIFEGPHDQYQERYTTWKEAEEGHKKALLLVKKKKNRKKQ